MIFNMSSGGGNSIEAELSVSTPPAKTTYTVGESIDLTGCVIVAEIEGISPIDITDLCTFAPSAETVVNEETTEITVTYVANGMTYTTSIPITVTYLPYTTSEILCEATVDNYNETDSWGDGRKPYQMNGDRAKIIDGSDTYISYYESMSGAEDVNLTDIPELGTVYIVAKVLDFGDTYGAITAFGHHNDQTQIPSWLVKESSGDPYSTYDVTSNATGKEVVALPNAVTNFNVYALSADGNGNFSWYATNYERHEQLNNYGKYVTMSYVYNDNSPCHCNLGIKYFAVVRGAESAEIIRNNIAYLNNVFIPSENSQLTINYALNQIGDTYIVTDGEDVITGVFDNDYSIVVSLHPNRTYMVSVEGVTYGQVTTRRTADNYEINVYTPDTMRIYTGYNDDKYAITLGDGETYNIPFETARGKVTQNVHEYTYDGILIRIEFSATETQTNAVTGTVYFNGANPFTFSADAKGYNPSYGVDTIINLPINIAADIPSTSQIPSDLVKNNTLYYTGYGESFYGNSIDATISDELYNFITTDEKYALRQGVLVNLLSRTESEIFIFQFPCEPRYENRLLTGIRNIGDSRGYWYNWRPAKFNSDSHLLTKDGGQWWSHDVAPGDYITDLTGWRYLNISPTSEQFYVPANNPFADYEEPVTAFWATKNIERLYYTAPKWTYGMIYDEFSPDMYVVVFWDSSNQSLSICLASETDDATYRYYQENNESSAFEGRLSSSFSYDGKKVYYRWVEDNNTGVSAVQTEPTINTNYSHSWTRDNGRRAWLMVYGGYDE